MDVNISLPVRLRLFRCQQICLIVIFRSCRSYLEHASHRSISVNIRIITLHIALARIYIRNLIDCFHQACVCFSDMCSLCPVQNKFLRRLLKPFLHQSPLYRILHLLDLRRHIFRQLFKLTLYIVCHICSICRISFTCCLHRL